MGRTQITIPNVQNTSTTMRRHQNETCTNDVTTISVSFRKCTFENKMSPLAFTKVSGFQYVGGEFVTNKTAQPENVVQHNCKKTPQHVHCKMEVEQFIDLEQDDTTTKNDGAATGDPPQEIQYNTPVNVGPATE